MWAGGPLPPTSLLKSGTVSDISFVKKGSFRILTLIGLVIMTRYVVQLDLELGCDKSFFPWVCCPRWWIKGQWKPFVDIIWKGQLPNRQVGIIEDNRFR